MSGRDATVANELLAPEATDCLAVAVFPKYRKCCYKYCYLQAQFSRTARTFNYFQRHWIFNPDCYHFQGFLKHAINPE